MKLQFPLWRLCFAQIWHFSWPKNWTKNWISLPCIDSNGDWLQTEPWCHLCAWLFDIVRELQTETIAVGFTEQHWAEAHFLLCILAVFPLYFLSDIPLESSVFGLFAWCVPFFVCLSAFVIKTLWCARNLRLFVAERDEAWRWCQSLFSVMLLFYGIFFFLSESTQRRVTGSLGAREDILERLWARLQWIFKYASLSKGTHHSFYFLIRPLLSYLFSTLQSVQPMKSSPLASQAVCFVKRARKQIKLHIYVHILKVVIIFHRLAESKLHTYTSCLFDRLKWTSMPWWLWWNFISSVQADGILWSGLSIYFGSNGDMNLNTPMP